MTLIYRSYIRAYVLDKKKFYILQNLLLHITMTHMATMCFQRLLIICHLLNKPYLLSWPISPITMQGGPSSFIYTSTKWIEKQL